MLLKWIFILLAVIWLYRVFRPYLNAIQKPPAPPPPPPPTGTGNQDLQKDRSDDEGEYIDYEEVK